MEAAQHRAILKRHIRVRTAKEAAIAVRSLEPEFRDARHAPGGSFTQRFEKNPRNPAPSGPTSNEMLIQAAAIVLLLASAVMAKRSAPEVVPAISTDKAVFSVPHFARGGRTQNGGFVEAHHSETKKLLWRIQLYKTHYDRALSASSAHG